MKELVSDPTRAAPVIEVNNVSMAYRLYSKPTDLLKEALFGGVHHDTFWAVRDVSLEVFEGERVGIIGPNGAGKSTLLQIITGNLKPAAGQVRVIGRISSLLSMVPAWNSEETGIQNIKFNLFMQGTPERQIPRLIEEIVEFTELGAFIYHPVKTYSTGMSTRLSFAIATATEPDILIIDEVLGTGDGYFAAKAHRRMLEFCARGRALLFVSHALPAVRQMCSRVMWMQNGSVRLQGEADYVLKQYELDYRKAEDEDMVSKQLVGGQSRELSVSPDEILDKTLFVFALWPTRRSTSAQRISFARFVSVAWAANQSMFPWSSPIFRMQKKSRLLICSIPSGVEFTSEEIPLRVF